jgi:diketogulonate reductase-like aldo/keto reductase
VTIPKSVRRERVAENAALFYVELSPDDMAKIDALDLGQRVGSDPDNFKF